MFRLLKLTLREKKWVTLSLISTVFVALFTALFVNLVQPIIDEMWLAQPAAATGAKARLLDVLWRVLHVSKADIKSVLPYVLVVVFFGKSLFTFLSSFFMRAVGNKVVKTLRDRLYEHILYQSTSYLDRTTTGDLMSRLTNDVDRIQQAVGTAMSDLIEEAFILAGILLVLFINDWKLAMMAFVVAPLAAVPIAAFSRQLKRQGRKSQQKMAEIYNLVHETISGHRIVKAFSMERFELGKFLKASARYFRINLKLAWTASLSSPFMEFVGAVVGAFILAIGSRRIAAGQISAGDFGAFAVGIFYMFTPIKRLTRANNVVVQAVACLDRVEEVLRVPPEIQDRPAAYPLPRMEGRVRFENVSFSYQPDRPVLLDVSFEVEPRQTVALVGFSGAGKTTIVNLLARFYEPGSGRVLIDGIDLREVTLASLRAQIGLVTQDIILFNDTVRANIAYGQDDVPQERIEAAARAAECHPFIAELPRGYDTPVGERGTTLSGGQRQRVALARALLLDPRILIMDDSTSSVDFQTEVRIHEALDRLMRGRTSFVIAQRISTVRNADLILVLDQGQIAARGTHDELLETSELYADIYSSQLIDEPALEAAPFAEEAQRVP